MFTNMDILVFTRFGAVLFLFVGLLAGFCFSKSIFIEDKDFSTKRFVYGIVGIIVCCAMGMVLTLHNPIVGGG